MTDKDNTPEFSIEKLKAVTDKQNKVRVTIPSQIFTYRSYYGMPNFIEPDEDNEDFSAIISALAYLLDVDMPHLMRGAYERYWAMLMEVDYHKAFSHPKDIYKDYFNIVQGTKIAAKMHENNILWVYNDGRILVVTDKDLARKLQKIRSLDEE